MRKHTLSVLAAAAVGLTASMASAADLPRKAPAYVPPPAPPPLTWTGCYIGGNVGGVFTQQSADFNVGSISHDNSGFTGGGQIGCDYQWAGGWVIGFRNMFNGTSGGGKTVTLNGFEDAAFNNATVTSQINGLTPDGPARLCVVTRLVNVLPGRRGLGKAKATLNLQQRRLWG
jgi:outer membrane immunogenic protein